MASATDEHVSDDDDADEDDDASEPSDDPTNPDAYDTDEERECYSKKELALSGCLYDVHQSLSLSAPVTFRISRAY